MNLTEVTKESTHPFHGKMLDLYYDTIALPNGETATREYIQHINAVAVVVITEDNKLILERQYRYPVKSAILEVPAGKLDEPEEDTLLAAQRELLEETGITADSWTVLGEYVPAPAYCDEKITLYLAKDLHKGEQHLDEDEFLEIVEVPFEEALEMIRDGRITDGKTQVAVMMAALKKA